MIDCSPSGGSGSAQCNKKPQPFRSLAKIHPLIFFTSRNWLIGGNSLQVLPADFFSSYNAVKYINLSYSKLHKIADFAFGLQYLVELNLRGNDLISLSAKVFAGAESLKTIDLSRNKISLIHPETFVNLRSTLREINLSHNLLHNNSFDRNGVDWIDDISSLRILDLSNNKLFYHDAMPYEAFSGLANLEVLNLNNNKIIIDYGNFASNQNLKSLDFSYNSMTYFDLNFLLSVPSLESLKLHGNGISYATQIDLTDVKATFPSLQSLGISSNTFSCETLSAIIKKMMKASIQLVVEDGEFVNNQRNLRGVACLWEGHLKKTRKQLCILCCTVK